MYLKDDVLNSTRKVSNGKWREGLTTEDIKSVENLKDKVLKDTVKIVLILKKTIKNKKKPLRSYLTNLLMVKIKY